MVVWWTLALLLSNWKVSCHSHTANLISSSIMGPLAVHSHKSALQISKWCRFVLKLNSEKKRGPNSLYLGKLHIATIQAQWIYFTVEFWWLPKLNEALYTSLYEEIMNWTGRISGWQSSGRPGFPQIHQTGICSRSMMSFTVLQMTYFTTSRSAHHVWDLSQVEKQQRAASKPPADLYTCKRKM